MRTLLLFFVVLLCGTTVSAQINVSNDFESGLNGWATTGGGTAQTDRACNGARSFQDNVWSSSTTGSLTSPGFSNTTVDEVTIGFDYKIQNYNSDNIASPYDGTVMYGYTVNGGAFVSLGTIAPTAACTSVSATIAAGTLTAGDEITFRFEFTWGSLGDWDVYIDDFSATQPGFCTPGAATFGVDSDCDAGGSGGFFTEIAITDFGSATALVATNDQDATTLTLNAGSPSGLFGPFNNGDDVIITLTPDDNASCTILSSVLTQDVCPPANDECADATALTIDVSTDGTITSATDSGEDNCGFSTPDDDVWYSFEATSTTHFVDLVSRNGTSSFYDFYHAVYSGSCGALTNANCSDGNSSTTTGLTIGQTYYVQVFSYTSTANQVADFSITVTAPAPPPANDDCANAVVLTALDNTATSLNYASATGNDKPDVSSCTNSAGSTNGTVGNGIWYAFTGDGGDVTVTVDDSNAGDAEVNVFEGTCGALTCVIFNDDPEIVVLPTTPGTEYKVYVGAWTSGNSPSGEITITVDYQSLPVELTAFTGQTMEKANKLNWATANEDAASHYVVERAATGTTAWEAIAEVAAAGYATTESTYELMDEQPLASALYRLRMVDLDGSTEFSNIVRLDNGTALTDRLTVTPNPTFGDVTLSFVAETAGQANVILTDLTGRTVSQRTISVTEGLQTQTVSLADVAGGIYLVRVAVDGRQYVKRVVRR